MLYIETGTLKSETLDSLAVFLNQSKAAGLPVALAEQSFSAGDLDPALAYEIAPFLKNSVPGPNDRLIVLEAQSLDDAAAQRLRKLGLNPPGAVIAYGHFSSEQARLNAVARISYALGQEPDTPDIQPVLGVLGHGIPTFGAPVKRRGRSRLRVAIVNPPGETQEQCAAFLGMSRERRFELAVLTSGKDKRAWHDTLGYTTPVWHYNEIPPHVLAAQIDIAVFCGKPRVWPRFQALAANLLCSNCVVIDATKDQSWHTIANAVLPGPAHPELLANWLRQDIIPAYAEITASERFDADRVRFQLPPELRELVPKSSLLVNSGSVGNRERHVAFMPTNGVGLGHAKRCMVVAKAFQQPERAKFAAFPSCIGLLTRAGFDCTPLVARRLGKQNDGNDLVNSLRLSPFAAGAGGFVFDGGFVFPSVMNAVLGKNLPSVWIRRGLWQNTQNNLAMLDRQKIFERVVVPSEAFEELNAPLMHCERAHPVGPIVQTINLSQADKNALRTDLANSFGRPFEKLVVTMLGGGVAADRRAQIMAVSAHLAAKKHVLNLVVVYPTSIVDPGWFNHPNTRVVRTFHASALMQAADVFISAVGYNSFHEVIYGGVPTIFVPQMAPYMDDQRARGTAAAERGLADLVEPWEPLKLTGRIDAFLDGRAQEIREALAQVTLPEAGAEAAAKLIEEVCS